MNTNTERMHIREVGRVVVPVSDQDRAMAFYTNVLGFQVRADFTMGGDARWLEVALPDTATSLALVPPRGGMWETVGIDSRVSLVSDDIETDHRTLREEGVDTDEILRFGPQVPAMFFFRDPDGNTLQIVEHTSHDSDPHGA